MNIRILFVFLICCCYSIAQQASDTINRYNSRHKKDGYWVTYIDSNLNLSSKEKATYYGFEHYDNGKNPVKNYFKAKWKTKCELHYVPTSTQTDSNGLILLDGSASYLVDGRVSSFEFYVNGFPKEHHDYAYYKDYNDSMRYELIESIYYDSIYNGNRETALDYQYSEGKPQYKIYIPFKDYSSSKIYFPPYTSYGPINRLRVGYYYQHKSFLEVGYSFKNTGGTIDSTHRGSSFEEDNFGGFAITALGNYNKNGSYFGQKVVYNYCLSILGFEAGIVNYTDFKFTSNDTRAMFGAGLTLMGRFSIMYHYSIPLTASHFQDISRHSIGIMLF